MKAYPRLNAWYGDSGAGYAYSGLAFQSLPWLPELVKLRHRVELSGKGNFNSALLNLYRTGRDSVVWHNDDEPELGQRPVIASISLGAVRNFELKSKTKNSRKFGLALAHGSLLLITGETQHHWLHQLPVCPVSIRQELILRSVKSVYAELCKVAYERTLLFWRCPLPFACGKNCIGMLV